MEPFDFYPAAAEFLQQHVHLALCIKPIESRPAAEEVVQRLQAGLPLALAAAAISARLHGTPL